MPIVRHAVIAAAGLGSRLGHGKPKCLVEVGGATVLAHLLSHLRDVEDVRIVVGFEEEAVIAEVRRLRSDVIVVRNPAFRSTTTLHSYALGARYLTGDCLFMDGDLLVEPRSFVRFAASCRPGVPRLAVTASKTTDAVYVLTDGDDVTGFRRGEPTDYEWANIAWLPVAIFESAGDTTVYQHLSYRLPIAFLPLVSYEIDTQADLALAMRNLDVLNLPVPAREGATLPGARG